MSVLHGKKQGDIGAVGKAEYRDLFDLSQAEKTVKVAGKLLKGKGRFSPRGSAVPPCVNGNYMIMLCQKGHKPVEIAAAFAIAVQKHQIRAASAFFEVEGYIHKISLYIFLSEYKKYTTKACGKKDRTYCDKNPGAEALRRAWQWGIFALLQVAALVKGGVEGIEVLGVQPILHQTQGFAEAGSIK